MELRICILLLFFVAPHASIATLSCTCPVQNASIPARLVGGSGEGMGRVELLYNGEWGTICNRGLWTKVDADVICRQLGYEDGALAATSGTIFGPGTGPILVDNVICRGHEMEIADCNYTNSGWGKVVASCRHTWDAGVICKVTPDDKVEVRLTGGTNRAQGRLEVGLRGTWGYVCDSYWNIKSAQVVCRQLGYSGAVLSVSGSFWGQWPDRLIMTGNVQCHGGEENIDDCRHTSWGYGGPGCRYDRIVNIVCQEGNYNVETVRLVDGGRPSSGRVEVGFNNTWATVCDRYWDRKDADVVCKKLGYTESLVATTHSTFGGGDGRIWTDSIHCLGEERSLTQCPGTIWGKYDATLCGSHNHDVGVVCKRTQDEDIEIRLVGGPDSYQGRVEVGLGGVWGTLCDQGWDLADATVICRHLGFGRAFVATRGGVFAFGVGRIWTQNVDCTGSERTLRDCAVDGWGNYSSKLCSHDNDAGVICGDAGESVQVRLDGGNRSGRVEIGFRGNWGTICSRGWEKSDASVICQQLGYQQAFAALSRTTPGRGRIWTFDVNCHGSEDNILNCITPNGWGYSGNCTHLEDAGVVCGDDLSAVEVRLEGGNGSYGRVEVGFEGMWGTVCHNGWDEKDALVVCRMLGYTKGLASNFSTFGNGHGRIWLSDVDCNGEEESIADCVTAPWGEDESCDHSMDAGVICLMSDTKIDVRLVGGANESQGRVEIGFYGAWGRVCDDYWDIQDAKVVCKMLGYPHAIAAIGPSTFGDGSGRVWVDNVWCKGEESTLLDCPLQGWGVLSCRQGDYAGVICSNEPPKLDIRLVGGSNASSGRVEVGMNGAWGTICDTGWDILDAQVVCRELGYSGAVAAVRGGVFGPGTGRIWVYQMGCYGEEKSLMDCDKPGLRWGVVGRECSHYDDDAGVVCQTSDGTSGVQARLMRSPGDSEVEGRVLIGLGGAWGSICYSGWGLQDANVVCRHLGYTSAVSASSDNIAGSWPGRVWLQDLRCNGNENSLLNCSHPGWGISTRCTSRNRYRFARVVCSNETRLEDRVQVSASPSSIVVGTGGDTSIRCSFTGLDLTDYNVRWRVNESDLSINETLMKNYLTRREGNTEVLIFRKSVWSLSGSYSCELVEYSTIRSPDVSVSIEPGCMPGIAGSGSRARIGESISMRCRDVHHGLEPLGVVTWRCVSDQMWEGDFSSCTHPRSSQSQLMMAFVVVKKTVGKSEEEEVQEGVKAVLEKQISPIANFRGSFVDTGIFNTTGVIATIEVNGLRWRDLQWDEFAGSNINIGGTFIMVEVRDGVVFPNNDECICPIKYTSSEPPPYVAGLCKGLRMVDQPPCVCSPTNETDCTCSTLYTKLSAGQCSLDTDGDGIPNHRDDCEFCCSEENLHGFQWPRISHGLQATHLCSSLHPAFTDQSTITRQCTTRGRWGDVDYSGCTFKTGTSLTLGVVEVTAIAMATSEFRSKNGMAHLTQMVRAHLSGFTPGTFTTVSILDNLEGNAVVTMAVELPQDTNVSILQPRSFRPMNNRSEFVFSDVPLVYAFTQSGQCVCRRLQSLWLPTFIPICTGPVLPPCSCLNGVCKCVDPYSKVVGSTQCSMDKDGDQVPDIEDDSPQNFNGYTEHTNCEVDTNPGSQCPPSHSYGIRWLSEVPCSFDVQRCRRRINGVPDIGVARRLCNGSGAWEEPDLSTCERRDLWKTQMAVTAIVDAILRTNPLLDVGLKVDLREDQVTKLREAMNMITRVLTGQNEVLYPRDVHRIVDHLSVMMDLFDVTQNDTWKKEAINATLNTIDSLVKDQFTSSWKQQDKVSGGGVHTVGMLLSILEKAAFSFDGDELNTGRLSDGIDSVTRMDHLSNIVFDKYRVNPLTYQHNTLVFRGRGSSNMAASQPVVRIPRELIVESSRQLNEASIEVVVTQMIISDMLTSTSAVNISLFTTSNTTVNQTHSSSIILSCQVGRLSQENYKSLEKRPLELFFPLTGPVTSGECVYWSSLDNSPGYWSDNGVDTEYQDDGILCRSHHLSSFTVLSDVVVEDQPHSCGKVRERLLMYSSYFSAPIAILLVLAAIVAILATRRKDAICDQSYFIRISFCVSLLLGLVVLTGGFYLAASTASSQPGCIVVSALLHYFILSVFCWLLCEAIHIFRLIVVVHNPNKKKWFLYYFMIGWGSPLLVVAISLAARHELYRVTTICLQDLLVCWLPFQEGLISAFLVPVGVCLVTIIVLLCVTLKRLYSYAHDDNNKRVSTPGAQQTVQDGRNFLKGHLIVATVTTLTWVIGSLAPNLLETIPSLGWIFFILVMIQGITVCVTFIAVDAKVRKEIICCKKTVGNDDGAAVLYSPEESGTVKLTGIQETPKDNEAGAQGENDNSSIHSANVDNDNTYEEGYEEKTWMDKDERTPMQSSMKV